MSLKLDKNLKIRTIKDKILSKLKISNCMRFCSKKYKSNIAEVNRFSRKIISLEKFQNTFSICTRTNFRNNIYFKYFAGKTFVFKQVFTRVTRDKKVKEPGVDFSAI